MKHNADNECCVGCLISRRAVLASGVGLALALPCGCFNRSIQSQTLEQNGKGFDMGTSESEKLRYVTLCGLYCGLCSQRGRIPQQARALRDTLAKDGFDQWGQKIPNFKEFWTLLNQWSDLENACPGCRQGGGNPECAIRICAQQRQVESCPLCEEYPCERIQELGKVYPTLIADGGRLKDIGVNAWISEQQKRAETGFVYSDIRND